MFGFDSKWLDDVKQNYVYYSPETALRRIEKLLEVKKDEFHTGTFGVTLAITQDKVQESLWGPALEKYGFIVLKKFTNKKTGHMLTMRGHFYKPAKE
jgi:hypothetical protein